MMILKATQKGQALILIALAAIGLFAFTALAIDGSAVFSDHRHAQNAADTGAYAAGLSRIRGNTEAEWKQAALDRVQSNGYTNNGVNEVKVYSCLEWKTSPDNPAGTDCPALPTGADPDEYVYVRIKSVVDLYFARVIGWRTMTNRTDAIVRAEPIDITEWFDGMAFVSANTRCPDPGDFGPFETGGSSNTVVTNSGVFVNAKCPLAFRDNGGGTLTTAEGVCVVGGVDPGVSGVNPPPQANCGEQIDINQYWMPDTDPALLAPYCDNSTHPGSITSSGGEHIATPGYYSGTFPSKSGTVRLQKGVYCLDGGLRINSGEVLTTDVNNNGAFDPATEGVFIYLKQEDFLVNGHAIMKLRAMTSTAGGWPSQLMRYLIFVPASNPAQIDLAGTGDSTFTGMVLAPTSNIDIHGDSTGLELHTQIISLNTRLGGNGTVDVTYDPNDVPPAIIMPKLSPTE